MRTTSWFAAAALAVAVGGGVSASDLQQRARDLFSPIPAGPARLEANPATPEKIELGRMLFFEPRLSASGLISCNTCHNLGTGGDDNLQTSVGHGWQKGPRNAPTVLNAVFNKAQFWDGRAEDLKAQAKGPVQAGVEMANKPEGVVTTLKSMPEYVARFARAFPGEADPVTFDNMALAIEAFEATLIDADRAASTAHGGGRGRAHRRAEARAWSSSSDKGCATCHRGVNLGGQAYYPFGLSRRPGADILPVGDKGRFAVTKTGERRVRLPRRPAAQHRADRAVLPLGRGVGPARRPCR